ncbi:MAG: hypothetical protein U0Q19_20190 [Kineosporiaceae bacterium]
MTFTYEQALGLIGAVVPNHLIAEVSVPILTGVQAQGDLLVIPVEGGEQADVEPAAWRPVPPQGVQLIWSEATGNTHWLHQDQGCAGVRWAPPEPPVWADEDDPDLRLAYVSVPPGQAALLIHTEEHGANGIGPGSYVIHRKREADPASVQRLLAD